MSGPERSLLKPGTERNPTSINALDWSDVAVARQPWCRRIVFFLLIVILAWQGLAAFRPPAWIVASLTVDDTYLALQVAHNWAEHGFPTFDGLHRTNGFQALWGLILWLLALLTRDPPRLLHATLLLVAVLNAVGGLLLWRFARRLAGDYAGLWAVAFWTAYCLSGRPALIGLENSLLATLFVLALLAFNALLREPRCLGRWTWAAVVSGLLFWTRLDMLVPVAVTWVALAVWALRSRNLTRLAPACAILLVLAAGLAAFNYWAGETPTPVSGLVKHVYATRREPDWTLFWLASAVVDTGRVLLKHAAIGIGAIWPPALSSVTRVGIVALLLFAAARGFPRPRAWGLVWAAALVLHALAIRVWLSGYYSDALWYYSAQNVSAAIGLGLLLAWLMQRVRRPRWRLFWPTVVGLGRLPLAILALFLMPNEESVSSNRLAAAEWLRQNVPAEARVGAWNAGELAFFSGRTVINLDGLVNDKAYFDLIKTRRTGISYLHSQNITWVVDYAQDAGVSPRPWWGLLPRRQWDEVARFGRKPEYQQLVIRRKTDWLTSPDF